MPTKEELVRGEQPDVSEAGPELTVVFDARCAVCRSFQQWAVGRDREGRLRFVDNRSEEAAALLPGLSEDRRTETLHALGRDGRRHAGAGAVFRTVGATGGLLGWVCRRLSVWPVYVAFEPGYRLFARYRGRFARSS